jgi:hypothetical protein
VRCLTSIRRARAVPGRILFSTWDAVPGRAVARRRSRQFVDDLRRLNATLADTSLAERYWLWGGLLLGWARDGAPLVHDRHDADFAVMTDDVPHFEQAVRGLTRAGFVPLHRFFNNDGKVMEWSFVRHGFKFDFFRCERSGGGLRYHLFSTATAQQGPVQAIAVIPDQPLVTFTFLSATWRRHADHDAELTRIYGDWRTPAPDWCYMDDLAIVEREPWAWGMATRWFGEPGGAPPRREA